MKFAVGAVLSILWFFKFEIIFRIEFPLGYYLIAHILYCDFCLVFSAQAHLKPNDTGMF